VAHLLIEQVVLLDEADVFLEQRSLRDLQRNALVSGKPVKALWQSIESY
jgi:hypothetical protein